MKKGGRTVGQDLSSRPVGGHPALAGPGVAPVLQADDLAAFRQLLLGEVAPVLVRHLDADHRAVEAELLSLGIKKSTSGGECLG